MAIPTRTKDVIRDAILSDWQARMGGLGLVLDTQVGAWAYELADALAVDLLRLEGSAETIGAEIFPASASVETLERMATLQGQSREEGIPGQWNVTVAGADGVVDLTGRRLSRNGLSYSPGASTVTVTAGSGTLAVVADGDGEEYDLDPDDTLTWTSAPTGLQVTATVDAPSPSNVAPTETESDAALAERVQDYRRARPASGNSADLIERAIRHKRVAVAYCYPCLAPNAGAYSDGNLDTPGAFVLVVAGPAQGTGATNTRNLDPGGGNTNLNHVIAYFAGTEDDEENATPAGARRYCSQLDPSDVGIERPIFSGQSVDITPEVDVSVAAPAWTGSMSIDGSSTSTSLVVSGDQRTKNGKLAAVQLSSSGTPARGRVEVTTLPDGTYDGGTGLTTWALTTPLTGTPSGFVDPVGGNRAAIVTQLFNFFDSLGPGDVPSAGTVAVPAGLSRRRRFPPESWGARSNIHPGDIFAAVLGAPGVLDLAVTTPGALVTANPKTWFYLDQLRIRYP